MNKSQFIRNIKEFLDLDDFKPISVGAGAMFLVRENEMIKEEIVISYKKYPGVYILRPSISGWKTFKTVDKILAKYFITNNINYRSTTIHYNSRRNEQIGNTKISSSKDLKKILPSLKEMIIDDILSFFNQYETLESVHDKIEDLELSELANFVTNPPHPRVMIIKRIVCTKNWESYCEEVIEIYKEQSKGKYKAVFAPIYAFLQELFEELKKEDFNKKY